MDNKQTVVPIHKHPSLADILLYQKEAHEGFVLKGEHFEDDIYLDDIIDKPWGHEYRVFADNFFDVWKLSISAGQKTSMHCHPRKNTTLLCLSGTGEVRFLEEKHVVSEGDYIHISKGVFHSTENLGSTDLELIEVEMPRNKFDLVRAQDNYGRQRTHYENQSSNVGDAPAMSSIPSSGLAKMRDADIHGRYRMEVTRQLDFAQSTTWLFVVSIGIENAINQHIEVHNAKSISTVTTNLNSVYLVISKTEEHSA